MGTLISERRLYCHEPPRHDKVYVLRIVLHDDGAYRLWALWGRRGTPEDRLRSQVKYVAGTERLVMMRSAELASEKIRRGYVDESAVEPLAAWGRRAVRADIRRDLAAGVRRIGRRAGRAVETASGGGPLTIRSILRAADGLAAGDRAAGCARPWPHLAARLRRLVTDTLRSFRPDQYDALDAAPEDEN